MSLHTVIQKYPKETKAHHDANNRIAEEVYCIQNKSQRKDNTWALALKRKTRMCGVRPR